MITVTETQKRALEAYLFYY